MELQKDEDQAVNKSNIFAIRNNKSKAFIFDDNVSSDETKAELYFLAIFTRMRRIKKTRHLSVFSPGA